MKVRVAHVSDLHLEFGQPPPVLDPASYDVLLATGDIAVGQGAKAWLQSLTKPVIYVLGNHEYYQQYMENLRAQFREWHIPHVHVLDPDKVEIETNDFRLRVIGATLWTDYRLYGQDNERAAMQQCARALNDHRLIMLRGERFMPVDAQNLHAFERGFIAGALSVPFDGITVVATHHAPTPKAIAATHIIDHKKTGSLLSAGFVSDLEHLMPGVDLWAFGHTHHNVDVRVGACRVVSNQRGYPHEIPDFAPKVFEVAR